MISPQFLCGVITGSLAWFACLLLFSFVEEAVRNWKNKPPTVFITLRLENDEGTFKFLHWETSEEEWGQHIPPPGTPMGDGYQVSHVLVQCS